MDGKRITYPSGAASLFAVHARAEVQNVCPWCLELGKGSLIIVNGCLVLSGHAQCRREAAVRQCTCCDPLHAGDDPACQIHGGRQV